MVLTAAEKVVYMAKLAAQAERYEEMAKHVRERASMPQELSRQEVGLMAVACSNVLDSRRAALNRIRAAESEERALGDVERAVIAGEYRAKIESELDKFCKTANALLEQSLRANAMDNAAIALCRKMRADNLRCIADVSRGEARLEAMSSALRAYEEASCAAGKPLPAGHPVCLSIALNCAALQREASSQMTVDVEAGCKMAQMAPLSTSYLHSWAVAEGGVGPKGLVPTPELAHRLCSLLLTFPEASISGVRWSVLRQVYADTYGGLIDLASLGYESPLALARCLLLDILRPAAGAEGDEALLAGAGPGLPSTAVPPEPLIAVADAVALTPMPGLAGTWPALYQALCSLVRSHGTSDSFGQADATDSECVPAYSLLMSRMRPLLQSIEEEQLRETTARSARNVLLSQLLPNSQLKQSNLEDQGWAFRDETGSMRTLQKIGHLVKAVLHWRDSRVEWQKAQGMKATEVDLVLGPQLQLEFSKQKNNLVLRLVDCRPPPRSDAEGKGKQPASSPGMPHASEGSAAGSAGPAPAARGASVREVQAAPEAASSAPERRERAFENPFRWVPPVEVCTKAAMGDPAATLDPKLQRLPSSVQRLASPMQQREEGDCAVRSSSCRARAPSLEINDRARSLNRRQREPRARSVSQHWADIVDDPLDPPLVANWLFTVRKKRSEGQSDLPTGSHSGGQGHAATPTESASELSMREGKHSSRTEARPQFLRNLSPAVHLTRSSSWGARSPSCQAHLPQGRDASLRRPRDLSSESVRARSPEPRSMSEPPPNIFDDPFEPPPEERWRAQGLPFDSKPNLNRLQSAVGQLPSVPIMPGWIQHCCAPVVIAPLDLLQHRSKATESDAALGSTCGPRLYLAQMLPQLSQLPQLPLILPYHPIDGTGGGAGAGEARAVSDARAGTPGGTAGGIVGGVAARSLSPRSSSRWPRGSPARRGSRDSRRTRSGETLEPRTMSEPPQQRMVNVFDDPFEPPPEEVTWPLHELRPLRAAASGRSPLAVLPHAVPLSARPQLPQLTSIVKPGHCRPYVPHRWASPRREDCLAEDDAAQRRGFVGGRSPSCWSRARSLTRAPRGRRLRRSVSARPPENSEAQSEPPNRRASKTSNGSCDDDESLPDFLRSEFGAA